MLHKEDSVNLSGNKRTRADVRAREIGGACLTEVESVGRLRVSSRGHRSAFSRIRCSFPRETSVSLYRRAGISYGSSPWTIARYRYRAAAMTIANTWTRRRRKRTVDRPTLRRSTSTLFPKARQQLISLIRVPWHIITATIRRGFNGRFAEQTFDQ